MLPWFWLNSANLINWSNINCKITKAWLCHVLWLIFCTDVFQQNLRLNILWQKKTKQSYQHPVRQINIWHQWLMFISLFISSVCDVGYGKKDGECEECPVGTYYKYGQRFTFVPTFKEGSCVACKNGFTTAGPKTLSSRDCGKFTPDLN